MSFSGQMIGPEGTYALLMANGATPSEAYMLTAIAGAESAYYLGAYNETVTSSGNAHGLFQHMDKFWADRSRAAGVGGANIFDPTAQAKVAIMLFRSKSGARHWEAFTNGSYQKFLSDAERASTSYTGATSGTGAQDYFARTGESPTGYTATTNTGDAAGAQAPSGGTIYNVDGKRYLVYQVAGSGIFYEAGDGLSGSETAMTSNEWQTFQITNRLVNGGNTAIFSDEIFTDDFGGYQSFDAMWAGITARLGLGGNYAALSDPTIVNALLQYIARPDMDPLEFENLIRMSDYYAAHTDRQREWNDLSPAQQQLVIKDMAAQLAIQWRAYTGQPISMSDPDLLDWAFKVASGTETTQTATLGWIIPEAEKDSESTYSRLLRNEEIARGQFSVDIDEQAQKVKDLYESYGVQMDFASAQKIGEELVMNRTSMAAITQQVQDMASGLYPHKPREISTDLFSQPYRMQYAQIMETTDPGMFDGMVQSAMREGMSLTDFRRQLKSDERWQYTKNARDEYANRMSSIGRLMGF